MKLYDVMVMPVIEYINEAWTQGDKNARTETADVSTSGPLTRYKLSPDYAASYLRELLL
jgi:hypothetical protein